MSKFSYKLKELFSVKSVDKRMVAQALHIDRALLYRYMNDQAFPEDTGFLEQLRNELCLTPYEYKELVESYEITKLGEDVYQGRQMVAGILDNLLKQPQSFVPLPKPSPLPSGEAVRILKDRDMIYSSLLSIIMDERSTTIRMNMQPDQDFVCKSLFQILRDKATSQETQIRHVLRFQSKTGDNINSYNLNIFSRLLPMLYYCIFYTNSTYFANYYYNNQAAVDERAMDLFPNILITPWCVIVMSFSYDNGLLYLGEDVAEMYRKNFDRILENTFSFVKSGLTPSQKDEILENCQSRPYRDYIFKSHPSALIGLDEDFYTSSYMEKATKQPGLAEHFIEYHRQRERTQYSDCHLSRKDFFTSSGLRRFIETGTLATFYSEYALPLSQPDILRFFERYVKTIESNPNFECHMIQDEVPGSYASSFGIFIFDENTLVFENSRRRIYNLTSLIEVTEKSIVDAFYDYLNTGLKSSQAVLGYEETLAVLKEKIEELRQELKSSNR